MLLLLHSGEELHSVHPRHGAIEQHDIVELRIGVQLAPRLHPIRRRLDRIPLRRQVGGEQLAIERVVVDNEHGRGGIGHGVENSTTASG